MSLINQGLPEIDLLSKWITLNTKVVGKHCVENNDVTYLRIKNKKIHGFTAYYYLHTGEYISSKSDYTLVKSPLCEETKCISCFSKRQKRELHSVNELEVDDYIWLLEYVQKNSVKRDDCLLWTSSKSHGYALTHFRPFRQIFKRCGHRLAFVLDSLQDIPSTKKIEHICKNKSNACVNPQHLQLASLHHFNADREFGENHKLATITEDKAIAIKLSKQQGKTQKERAELHGVSLSIIKLIDQARTWRHIYTKEELSEIDNKREKRNVVTRNTVRKIKKYIKNHSYNDTAKFSSVGNDTVKMIKTKRRYADVCTDEESGDDEILDKWKQEHYYAETKQKIIKNIDKKQDQGEHWIWRGTVDSFGYGVIPFLGKVFMTHVASFVVFNNINYQFSKHELIRHKCLYRSCCNPNCLELGSYKDNMSDMVRDALKRGRLIKRMKLN